MSNFFPDEGTPRSQKPCLNLAVDVSVKQDLAMVFDYDESLIFDGICRASQK